MKLKHLTAGLAALSIASPIAVTTASAYELTIPSLVYRTGPYAPGGIPFANGYADYFKLIQERDGGINGATINFIECETAYNTQQGVECYENTKGQGQSKALVYQPLSTGITYQIIPKAAVDEIPIFTMGYGRTSAANGTVFPWIFNFPGTYWDAASGMVNYAAAIEGGADKLSGKTIALVYHNSAYGKEPIRTLEELSKKHGFKLELLPVDHPGQEQKATWLQIRRDRPDYVVNWGWGVMNSTLIKEAQATGYPRDKIYGVWWAGAEPDVKDIGEGAKGYNAITMQHGAEPNAAFVKEILEKVHGKGQGTGPKDEVGSVLYVRGAMSAMLAVEGVRRAQDKFGKGKVMTGEQVRWGLENLDLTQAKLDGLGFKGVMRPISTSCQDHMGAAWARIHTWDGSKWQFTSDWYQADEQIIKPMVKAAADKYAAEKKLTRRTPQDCQS